MQIRYENAEHTYHLDRGGLCQGRGAMVMVVVKGSSSCRPLILTKKICNTTANMLQKGDHIILSSVFFLMPSKVEALH